MLKTDYKDDILNTDVNVNRKFNIVRSNGTLVEQNVELRETTAFKQVGDSFGAKDINETNEAIVDVTSKLQNLQIGGRNLYRDTKYFNNPSVWNYFYNWTRTGETYNGFTVVSNNTAWNGMSQLIIAKEGEVYTFSAYIKNIDGVSAVMYTVYNIDNPGAYAPDMYNKRGASSPDMYNIPQSTDFIRHSFTFHVIQPGYFFPRIECQIENANKIEICGLKLERGNIATDWTPAPEDLMDTSITNSDIDTILNS